MKLGAARDQSPHRLAPGGDRGLPQTALRSAIASIATSCGKPDRAKARYLLAHQPGRGRTPPSCGAHYLLLVAGRGGVQEPQEPAPAKAGGDLAIRPVFHQLEARVEAHVFIAFLGLLPARYPGAAACTRWRRG